MTDPQQKHSKAYDLSEFRLLVVEDAPFISGLMSSALSEMGIGKIYVSPTVSDAKERILSYNAVQSSQNIDVLILDWLMPGTHGKELLTWIRAHKSDSIKYLPIIVCSAFASTELVEDSRDSGANEVMVKPVSAQNCRTGSCMS
ncbi:MAG: response regulator [Rhodospirillales bacterium]|nr:response regulator [Rhodospirillales bacterium]